MDCKVYALVGENAITVEDGQKVYEKIQPELRAGYAVDLDFLNVRVFASPFFNSAIGQLLKDIKPDELNRLLRVHNLNPVGTEVLKRVVENAKRYFGSDSYRKAQTEVLSKLAEDFR